VALRAGITTVFDTWGPLESLRRVRDRINAGTAAGSRIFLAGNIIGNGGPWSPDFHPYGNALNPAVVDEVNRHWEQGVGAELTWMPAADVRRVVRDYIAASGIDFVKYASSAHGQPRLIALSPGAQRAIVEEAHASGRTVQACTLTSEALTLAIDAGVDLLQHGSSTGRRPMPDALLARIAGSGLPCVVLLYTERYVAAGRTASGLSAEWRDALDVRERNARRLIEAGGVLLHATDGGVFGPDVGRSPWLGPLFDLPDVPFHLGRSHVLWHQAMIERGMAPMDALVASTRDIARAYHLGDDLGTVEEGRRADLLVLDADPLTDPANYGRIAHVMKDGEFVDRGRLPERPVLTRGHAADPQVE
jgi:imidazolonepropionase-like amidohydrolase